MTDFQFKPFEEMTVKDYETVGFMSGLEVHQQLLTKKKLFCRCPAGIYNKEYDAELLRHMRPTLSELGVYDGTALMEFKTRKNIIYRIHHDTVCTYEMDDTPPFEMNDDALDAALGIGMMFKSTMVDEIHIARKQYLDGSIPAGFQRTAIFCVNGKIPFKDKAIDVIQISIEEDSCREYSDIGHEMIWFTDRLGMPLIETVTAPQMKTPQEVAEVCHVIRKATRSTGWARTGVGASREDVNVSVRGGTRNEIKGVPSIKAIPLLTYNEAQRQWNLLLIKKALLKRGITTDTFTSKTAEVTKHLKKTKFQPIAHAINENKMVKAVLLKEFKNILNWKTQTNTAFVKEIADRVRVIACLDVLPNIIYSDALGESIASAEWQVIKKTMGTTDNDTVVLVWGNEQDADTAAKEIVIRAKELTIGVPLETRQALRDGTTGFERILPGADRMYPDTDLPPKQVTPERLQNIIAKLPKDYWKREKWYSELNIPKDVIEPLSTSTYATLFETLVEKESISPTLASVALIQFPKRLKKEKCDVSILSTEVMQQIFKSYKEKKIPKDGIYTAMKRCIELGGYSSKVLPKPCSTEEVTKELVKKKKELSKMNIYKKENSQKVLLGLVMTQLRGRVDGSIVKKVI